MNLCPSLHARFRDPKRWLKILSQHAQPGRWFMLLSMDPESQTRPFDQIYPNGFPSS